jgi:hypothetical protein
MTLGSDDFITAAYLDRCRVLLEQDPARGFGPDAVWMYNAQTGELGHCTRKYEMPTGNRTPIGAGRVYTRELLQRAAWRLWTLPANRGLDGMASRRLFALGYRLDQVNMAAIPGAAIVDYKSGQPGENLNEWAGLEFSRVLPVTQAAVQLLQWGLSQALPKTADAKANA